MPFLNVVSRYNVRIKLQFKIDFDLVLYENQNIANFFFYYNFFQLKAIKKILLLLALYLSTPLAIQSPKANYLTMHTIYRIIQRQT